MSWMSSVRPSRRAFWALLGIILAGSVTSLSATKASAASGTVSDFGPLRLGMTEDQFSAFLHGQIKLGPYTFNVFSTILEKRVSAISLIIDPHSIEFVPPAISKTESRDSDYNIRNRCDSSYHFLQRVAWEKWGKADYVGSGFENDLLTQWFFQDNSYIKISASLKRTNDLHCEVIMYLSSPLPHDSSTPNLVKVK